MLEDDKRKAFLNGVLVILGGLLLAGIPLNMLVIRDVYHHPLPVLPGDYRAWLMAHLEGLLNGLLIIALAVVGGTCRLSARASRVLLWSLGIAGWGNLFASVLSPLFEVRAMAFAGDPANDAIVILYTLALAATATAFAIVLRGLIRSAIRARPDDATN